MQFSKKHMLKDIIFKTTNTMSRKKIPSCDDQRLIEFVSTIVNKDRDIPIKITSKNIEIIIENNETELVKGISRELPIEYLYFSDHRKINITVDFTLNFQNDTIIINKKYMLQSLLYLKLILEDNYTENYIDIPIYITAGAKNAFIAFIKESWSLYFEHFRTIEDIYIFLMIFDYLDFEFVD